MKIVVKLLCCYYLTFFLHRRLLCLISQFVTSAFQFSWKIGIRIFSNIQKFLSSLFSLPPPFICLFVTPFRPPSFVSVSVLPSLFSAPACVWLSIFSFPVYVSLPICLSNYPSSPSLSLFFYLTSVSTYKRKDT